MKKILLLMIFSAVLSCKKDKESVVQNNTDSTKSVLDSMQIPAFQNGEESVAFKILPQNITSQKGRAIFKQNGNVLFYFDQNSNEGNIRIDGKDYPLNTFNFTENNYSISGRGVEIEAANGDFKDEKDDCVEGNFPEVKVMLNDKKVVIANITAQDCPNY
ncbi:hypothetical protein IV494_12835 [Kaistella sp. G5-32]|uniref:Uncharacterized protein n=1 Tax=Kaistella gelatinilytica TaxID=2787636 RepID=A0ABS0FEC2_9FLAO|nr:hypothetical protein [Kaistella gelatinilytica]MBF8458061.1 hypothetical protein [Kaistella gelatinilytica]